MITAKEFLGQDESGVYSEQDITKAMIEFAKIHVTEALKQASEKAEIENDFDNQKGSISIDSILTAYPLDNVV